MPAFYGFCENIKQILDSENKISDFVIYEEPFEADSSDIQKQADYEGGAKLWLFYFALNNIFDHFRDVEKFFYRISVAIKRYSVLFIDKYETGSSIKPTLDILKPKFEFFVSELGEWFSVGGNVLYPSEMLRKKNQYDVHRYDGKFLALMILYSAVFLYDERNLPDYQISPMQSGYGNVLESLWQMSRNFIKD